MPFIPVIFKVVNAVFREEFRHITKDQICALDGDRSYWLGGGLPRPPAYLTASAWVGEDEIT
jgi:hypothetical protein